MRLGKIVFEIGYVVDFDDREMTEHAREAVLEDVCNVVKFDEVCHSIKLIKEGKFSESDIPEFLRERRVTVPCN